MTERDKIDLMALLNDMGFTDVFIFNVIINCENGMGIGESLSATAELYADQEAE
jgi:hypothetical protein